MKMQNLFTKLKKLMLTALLVFSPSLFPSVGSAADVRPVLTGNYNAVVIEGDIVSGDFDAFINIVRENQGRISTVYIFSPGGDFREAMKIGRAMRDLGLISQAPRISETGKPVCDDYLGLDIKPRNNKNCICASAGFFIHIGGVFRSGSYLVVHRPSFASKEFGNLSEEAAKKAFNALQDSAKLYMKDMGVPTHIQEDVLGIPSDKGILLDEKTVFTYFTGYIPHLHEWLNKKCPPVSSSSSDGLDGYREKLLSIPDEIKRDPQKMAAKALDLANTLTAEEAKSLERMNLSERQHSACVIAAEKEKRIDSYRRFFGKSASDVEQDYAKWSQAPQYLGKHFYEVRLTEPFDQKEDFMGGLSLKKSRTAIAPSISLSDGGSKRQVVTSADLLSSANPSPEFITKVIYQLEKAWGEHMAGDGLKVWSWTLNNSIAELNILEAADGKYLHLSVEESPK